MKISALPSPFALLFATALKYDLPDRCFTGHGSDDGTHSRAEDDDDDDEEADEEREMLADTANKGVESNEREDGGNNIGSVGDAFKPDRMEESNEEEEEDEEEEGDDEDAAEDDAAADDTCSACAYRL
jgi:hypothetical protein